MTLKRCYYCFGRIWPWQHRGWYSDNLGYFIHWHSKCYEADQGHD